MVRSPMMSFRPLRLLNCLFFDDRYQLGGSPITPLNDMYDYLSAQLKTQGHFQGEGECPVDGVEHDHGHDHDHDH